MNGIALFRIRGKDNDRLEQHHIGTFRGKINNGDVMGSGPPTHRFVVAILLAIPGILSVKNNHSDPAVVATLAESASVHEIQSPGQFFKALWFKNF